MNDGGTNLIAAPAAPIPGGCRKGRTVSPEKRRFIGRLMLAAITATCVTLGGCTIRSQRSDALDVRLGGDTRAAQSRAEAVQADPMEGRDYDPWEPVNEKVFSFNYDLVDHYGLRPVAALWARALPRLLTRGLVNAFDNIDMPKRFVNNVLQGRLQGANRELTRFLVNSTLGIAGIFDVAAEFGFEKSYADSAQTLGVYGVNPGPYLVLPLMQPLTVRDGIGYGIDTFLDPIGYLAPFVANFGRSAVKRVNERATDLQLYQDVEESSLDLYSAVRNGYLQSREHSIRRAVTERDNETEWTLLRTIFSGDDTAERTADEASEDR